MNSKHTKNLTKSFLAIFCAFLMAFSTISVNADSVDALEKKTSDLAGELSDLNSQFNSLNSEIEELATQIEETDEEIEKTELDLAAAKLSADSQYESMKKRIKYMYENGNTSMLELICSARSMGEFLNNAEFVATIAEYDRDMLEQLQSVHTRISDKEKELKEKQSELASAKEQLDAKQGELDSTINSVKSDLSASAKDLEAAKKQEAQTKKPKSEQTSTSDSGSSSNSTSQSSPRSSSASEIALFAGILQCEAGSSDYDALLAVATVIMNRVESSSWPNSVRDVIYQKNQFSPASSGFLNRVLANGPASLCYTVAKDALNGKRLDKVKHCYSFRMAGTASGITIGGNVFF